MSEIEISRPKLPPNCTCQGAFGNDVSLMGRWVRRSVLCPVCGGNRPALAWKPDERVVRLAPHISGAASAIENIRSIAIGLADGGSDDLARRDLQRILEIADRARREWPKK